MKVRVMMMFEVDIEQQEVDELTDEINEFAQEFLDDDPEVSKVTVEVRTRYDDGLWSEPVIAKAGH